MGYPNKYDLHEKEFRKLEKESKELYQAKRKLGYIKLDKPIRAGWHKYLVLRDDIGRRKDAKVFEEILRVVGYKVWANDKKYLEKVWTKRLKKNRNISFAGVSLLNKKEYNTLSKKAQKYFEAHYWQWSSYYGFIKYYRCKIPKFYFTVEYARAYITHRKVIDPMLDQRIDEIQNLLDTKYISARHKMYGRWRWYDDNSRKRERRAVKSALKNFEDEGNLQKAMNKCYDW